MTQQLNVLQVSVSDLHFDHENPRLAEYGITSATPEDEVLQILWDAMDVRELVQSIAASGFFPQEALIVAEEDGRKIVIEGNRRLAAVKVLLAGDRDGERGWAIPELTAEAKAALQTLPVIMSNREEAWRFLGFKHVNGPAKWSSYAKAAYISTVHKTFGIPLADIANQIGDRHNTVQRLYRGLMVLEQAEREGVYNRENVFRSRLAFSHLYTGLDYEGIGGFLNIAPKETETDDPVPKEKVKELGELLVWLYGNKAEAVPPVVETQNPDLRRLNAVVANREAVAALRAGEDLSKSFEISRPATTVFEEALLAAKRELTTARAALSGGYDNSIELLKIAGTIATLADDMYTEMERKTRPQEKKSRITE
ncbi:ParB N-terminal domain-containing protein [Rhodoferax sp. GW822-FHT02A01]|uniref:ParB N-terminal domain-containing protein n=1 Tax=Rhodoferax sp. GW822-FHT02A01 TaxID=3141537 RepID=UPI00315C5C26